MNQFLIGKLQANGPLASVKDDEDTFSLHHEAAPVKNPQNAKRIY